MPDVFEKFPDNAEVVPFNNEDYFGLSVHWSLHGVGFGELVFAVDKKTMEATVDTECMGPKTCGKIMDILRDHGTLKAEHGFHDAGPGLSLPDTILPK
jgi:hypothetical protein